MSSSHRGSYSVIADEGSSAITLLANMHDR